MRSTTAGARLPDAVLGAGTRRPEREPRARRTLPRTRGPAVRERADDHAGTECGAGLTAGHRRLLHAGSRAHRRSDEAECDVQRRARHARERPGAAGAMTTVPFRPTAMARERSHDRWRAGLRLAATLMIASCVSAPGASRAPQAPSIGWKGNLHTHSLWSDGTDFPEMIVAWYRDHGYNFLSLTEHDLLQRDERWVDIEAEDAGWPPRNASARVALPGYRDRFGVDWVDERPLANGHLVRLRLLDEYRERFEEPGAFLLIEGEEITDREGTHVNAINLEVAIKPQGGETAMERIRNNVLAVNAQERRFRRPIAAIVNHPNWTWAWTAEDIAAVPEARIFEVYNGHLLINNGGDSLHVSTERIWDVALSLRHAA